MVPYQASQQRWYSIEQGLLQTMVSALCHLAACVIASNEILQNALLYQWRPLRFSCGHLHCRCMLSLCELQFLWIFLFRWKVGFFSEDMSSIPIPNTPVHCFLPSHNLIFTQVKNIQVWIQPDITSVFLLLHWCQRWRIFVNFIFWNFAKVAVRSH